LKRWLPEDLWADLEDTFTGAHRDANWLALFRTIDVMHRVAVEAGEHLGYAYPEELERRVIRYLKRVKEGVATKVPPPQSSAI
jgi:aminoglycoside 6-adenylyltransferase